MSCLNGQNFFRNLIVIRETNDWSDEYIPVFLKLEWLGCERIGTVTVSKEPEGFSGEFLELMKSHAHEGDTGTGLS